MLFRSINTKDLTYHSYILNDIDGGCNIWQINYLSRGLGSTYHPDMVDDKNRESVFSTLEKSELKYPELKDKFEALQKKNAPEDNPLFMIFRMK